MHIDGPFYEVAGPQQELGAGMTGQVSVAYMWDSEAKILHKVRHFAELAQSIMVSFYHAAWRCSSGGPRTGLPPGWSCLSSLLTWWQAVAMQGTTAALNLLLEEACLFSKSEASGLPCTSCWQPCLSVALNITRAASHLLQI